MPRSFFLSLFAFAGMALLFACQPPPAPTVTETIYVKGFWDTTGPTTAIQPYREAINDSILESNKEQLLKKGNTLYKIEIDWQDYAYDKNKAITIYDGWRKEPNWSKIVTVFGWGTNDAYFLSGKAKEDQKVYISASYLGSLATPIDVQKSVVLPDGTPVEIKTTGSPYNFYAGTDYSTAIRIAMKFVKDSGGQKLLFAGCTNTYCTDPLIPARLYAKEIGLEIAGTMIVEMTETQEQIDAKVKEFFSKNTFTEQDKIWIWLGNTLKTAMFTARSVLKHAPNNANMIANNWAFDETAPGQCKDPNQPNEQPCANRLFGVMPFALYGDLNYPEMKNVVILQKKWRENNKESTDKFADTKYVQGYAAFLLWKKAVEQLLKENKEITGPNIKAALETFSKVSTGGLTSPITFTPNDHRPTSGAFIYKVDAQGKLSFLQEVSIELKEDWRGW